MAEGEFYNIEKILDRRSVKGKLEYKIKWEGYSIGESTWEPLENLETAKELVAEYDQLNPFPKKKSVKQEKNKKDNTFINRKRSNDNNQQNENILPDNDGKIAENEDNKSQQNFLNAQNQEVNSDEIPNQNNNLNENKNIFTVNANLRNVITVKQQGQALVAIVEQIDENGNINKISIPTETLRKTNPWILLDFYESKIKFT